MKNKAITLNFCAFFISTSLLQAGSSPIKSQDQPSEGSSLMQELHPTFEENTSALLIAAQSGNVHSVDSLLYSENGADPLVCDSMGKNLLHIAAIKGHAPLVHYLWHTAPGLRGTWYHGEYMCGKDALHLAAFHNHVAVVKVLLDNGADAQTVDGTGFSLLHNAVAGNSIETVRLLLDNNLLPVNFYVNNGDLTTKDTPLHIAAQSGHFDMYSFLCSYGADQLAQNERGECPIDIKQDFARLGHYN